MFLSLIVLHSTQKRVVPHRSMLYPAPLEEVKKEDLGEITKVFALSGIISKSLSNLKSMKSVGRQRLIHISTFFEGEYKLYSLYR